VTKRLDRKDNPVKMKERENERYKQRTANTVPSINSGFSHPR